MHVEGKTQQEAGRLSDLVLVAKIEAWGGHSLRCRSCGKTQPFNLKAIAGGWPDCCGGAVDLICPRTEARRRNADQG